MESTRFEPFNLSLNFRNYGYSRNSTISYNRNSTLGLEIACERDFYALSRKVCPYDFEVHKNRTRKQFPIQVYYFMDYAVVDYGYQASESIDFKSLVFKVRYF